MNRAALLCLVTIPLLGCAPGGGHVLPPPPPPDPPFATEPTTLPPEQPPLGRLPADVRPLHYALELEVVPERERFRGTADVRVELSEPRQTIWMHGRDLQVTRASVRVDGAHDEVAATWEKTDASGVDALKLAHPVGPGIATIHLEYDAAFDTQPEGLFVANVAGKRYAFTDFEPSDARRMFPGFDEPAFKTPYDVTLLVPKGEAAIANERQLERAPGPDGLERVRFATTKPLPTYLVAIAVGPLDVVDGPAVPPNAVRKEPLPLRGVATAGRGPELAYALAHAGEIVSSLEGYFGIAYPYDKLDLLAVPGMGGAMENAATITFREWLLLVDDKTASVDQRRAFDSVVAHELSHQWFGDLVTMRWWDDIWLNEAFATWMSAHASAAFRPSDHAEVALLSGVERAMGTDALASARRIRQEIQSQDDVVNAFDDITYRKGGGVLGMFERWVSPPTFQRGIHDYLEAHRFGSGSTEDLLASLSRAAGRDVVTPFRTFLDQPGVPLVEVTPKCVEGAPRVLELRQSRYAPVGSKLDGAETWQIPVCARYEADGVAREACTLLTSREGTLPLEAKECPSWVMPNADGAGYYRFTLPIKRMDRLASASKELTVRERMAVVDSLGAELARAPSQPGDLLAAIERFADDPEPSVATAAMRQIERARAWAWGDPKAVATVEAHGAKLYRPVAARLGWTPKKNEPPEQSLLRERVLSFLALTARDPATRREAARRGRAYLGYEKDGKIHADAVDPNLVGLALAVAIQEGDAKLFDAAQSKLGDDAGDVLRARLIGALASATKPELAARARALSLDPRLRPNEIVQPLAVQMGQLETRADAWHWFAQNLDALLPRLTPPRAGWLPWLAAESCDATVAEEAQAVFAPRLDRLQGGPRNLAAAVEAIRICVARREKTQEAVLTYFGVPTPKRVAGP